ncbi:cytochrome c oxidase accessory protein CcoG, partial [Nonlabens mediterrranea]|nr:cytochrome c oxidase accessory protein CcoG [Nonlabens mediterrranea]
LRNDVEARVLRLPGSLYEHKGEDVISNVYTYKLVNKTVVSIEDIHFKLLSHKGEINLVKNQGFNIEKEGLAEGTLFIELHTGAIKSDKERVEIGIYSGDDLIETTTTSFLGPRSYK